LTNIANLLYLWSSGLKYIHYPDYEEESELGFLRNFLRKDLKRHNNLRLAVINFLTEVEEAESLDPFYATEEIRYLSHDGFFEMRIPPQQRGGVVRIYFIKSKTDTNTLVLLDAELKKDKSSNIKDRVKSRKRDYINNH
jgi:hypothetical protein